MYWSEPDKDKFSGAVCPIIFTGIPDRAEKKSLKAKIKKASFIDRVKVEGDVRTIQLSTIRLLLYKIGFSVVL
ncbi:hypothetical protein AHMF7605_10730 [Adhaeribacter arboris]|uniref:Uncharacterized protein n=1 Tax=Adhaeribacter arboris TaxID=2072846 RepID=A0A2T2YEM3_9BACT|nr:hypothetical protein AHMF7605_10730 [Adhaeribacter arboris]